MNTKPEYAACWLAAALGTALTVACSGPPAFGRFEHAIPADAGNPVTYNEPGLTEKMLPALRGVVGSANVVDTGYTMAAEDFSYFAKVVSAM